MCNSCEVMVINGFDCHEFGCPDKWKDETIECKECGFEFIPTEQYQTICPECSGEF